MIDQVIYTACVTPFNDDGSIDYASLGRIVRSQCAAENGIVLLGSTGEALSLTEEERRSVVDFVFNLGVVSNVVVGVPGHSLTKILEWIEWCNNFPISGYLVTAPIYAKPGVIGQTKWFEALLNCSSHPMMLYNIPSRAGVRIYPDVLLNLSQNKNFVAIKDSSGSVDSVVEYRFATPNIAVYCGDDCMISPMISVGAIGLVSVASNVWPSFVKKYVSDVISGNYNKNDSSLWWKACSSLFTASNPIPVKFLLKEAGIISSDFVRLPLSSEDLLSSEFLKYFHNKITAIEGV